MNPISSGSVSGACLFQMGLTRVLACVCGPMECARRSDERNDRANLSVTVKSSPFSSTNRQTKSQSNKQLLEIANDIQNAFSAAILLHLYPRAAIYVNVHILADDGGTLECAINATSLALINAGVSLKDLVCACSSGLLSDGTMTLVDVNKQEAFDSNVYKMSVATMPQRGSVILTKLSSRFSLKELERVLESATTGCRAVCDIMAQIIREHHALLVAARMGNVNVSCNALTEAAGENGGHENEVDAMVLS